MGESGFCDKCHKIWTLDKERGICQWCGKTATRQTARTDTLPSFKRKSKRRNVQSKMVREIQAVAERSYNQLEGDWSDWLEVAKRYEKKVPNQDRLDIRHDIIIELYRARQRDKKPLPILRAYRIASLTVALYWREINKASVRVCVFNGYATELHCNTCHYRPDKGRCAFMGVRPVESLEIESSDAEGHRVRLLDTVATDKAIDMPDQWTDITTWLLGCPSRLIDIACKKLEGRPLSQAEHKYLQRFRKQQQLKLF